jgi:hypothetical protein
MVDGVAEATQTDPAMPATSALSALSALSACTGGHAEIEIRSGRSASNQDAREIWSMPHVRNARETWISWRSCSWCGCLI